MIFEINITDLKPEVASELRAFLGDNGNLDIAPIATFEKTDTEMVPMVHFRVKCYALYDSELKCPMCVSKKGERNVSNDELLTYVRTHLNEAPVKELTFLDDLEDITDSVQEEDIRGIYFEEVII